MDEEGFGEAVAGAAVCRAREFVFSLDFQGGFGAAHMAWIMAFVIARGHWVCWMKDRGGTLAG